MVGFSSHTLSPLKLISTTSGSCLRTLCGLSPWLATSISHFSALTMPLLYESSTTNTLLPAMAFPLFLHSFTCSFEPPTAVGFTVQHWYANSICGAVNKLLIALQLWCWVDVDWDMLRVATFYGPVWIVVILTIGIYVKVGAVVFKWRRHLLAMEQSQLETKGSGNIFKTYEVSVTTTSQTGRDTTKHLSFDGATNPLRRDRGVSFCPSPTVPPRRYTLRAGGERSGGVDPHQATMKYCKCALLFFIALLITWVPSTVNRIWALAHPDQIIFGLNFAAALVLPLQGFWNAVIYLATSMYAVRCLLDDIIGYAYRARNNRISMQMRREGLPLGSQSSETRQTSKAPSIKYQLDTAMNSESSLVVPPTPVTPVLIVTPVVPNEDVGIAR